MMTMTTSMMTAAAAALVVVEAEAAQRVYLRQRRWILHCRNCGQIVLALNWRGGSHTTTYNTSRPSGNRHVASLRCSGNVCRKC